MPIYEYICAKCGLKFEELRAMSRAGEDACCPHCGGEAKQALSRFSRSSEDSPVSAAGNSCAGCSAGSCGSCSSA